jgi:hypothetical protein
VAGRNVSHYVEAECDKGGREIEIMGLLYIMVYRVPNENAETSLQVTWQRSNIDIMERHIKQLIHMVRGVGVLQIFLTSSPLAKCCRGYEN